MVAVAMNPIRIITLSRPLIKILMHNICKSKTVFDTETVGCALFLNKTAYQNPDGTVVVVYINNSDTNEYTKFSSSDYKKFETYVTDESRDLEKYQSGNTNVAVSIPAKSVTTVVLTPNAQ